jgi:hypothetical protein
VTRTTKDTNHPSINLLFFTNTKQQQTENENEKKNPISGSTNSGAPPPPPIPRRGARPRIGARNQKKNEKKWAGAGTGEEEKSGDLVYIIDQIY